MVEHRDKMNNVTSIQQIKHYFLKLNDMLSSFNRYRSTYRNYFTVVRSIITNSYPIHAILKNGKDVTIHNVMQAYTFTTGINNFIKTETDHVVIHNENLGDIRFKISSNNGEIMEVFFKEGYKHLPVRDQVVLDIGANIADTSIYFALRHAKQVIAVEPYPKNYEIAKENISLNGFSDKIQLILGGVSEQSGIMKLDKTKEGMFALEQSDHGLDVPIFTLFDLLSTYKPSILKMDCEGCEYSLLKTPNEALQSLTHIQIEYHDGFKNLRDKLEDANFQVSLISPFSISTTASGKHYLGYLLAKK